MTKLIFTFLVPLTLIAQSQLRFSATTVGPIYVESGVNAPSQTVNAFNIGSGSLNLAVTSSTASWLSGSVGQPSTCSGGPVPACIPITLTLNTSGLAIGNYTGYLTLNDPNAIDSPQTLTVLLQVDGTPSSATFYVTPNNGASTAQSETASLIVNTGSAVLSSVTTSSGGSWLNFTLTGNHVVYSSYLLRVSAQPGQGVGTYTGSVVLSGSSNSADDQNISVTLNITSQPILQIPTSPITINVVQGQEPQTSDVVFRNLGLGSLSITGATSAGGSWLSASPLGGGNLAISANPGSMTPGSYTATLTLASNAANTAIAIPVQMNIAAATVPTLGFGGVVDNAAYMTGLAAGSIGAAFGAQLATSSANASSFPLPGSLAGVQLLVNGSAVPLFYVSPNQIDFQLPFSLTAGQVMVQAILNGQPGNRVSANVTSINPRLFLVGQNASNGSPYGAVFNSDSTLALPTNLVAGSHPAHLGDVLTIYTLGLGPVSPPIQTGVPAPVTPLSVTTSPVQVVYGQGAGSVVSNAIYAGLAPFFAGLYQIDALLPQNAPTGDVPVTVSMTQAVSNTVEMSIGAAQ